jgi:hypothetical protein
MDSLWGGRTALVLTALVLGGEEKEPRFQKALTWLMKQEAQGTYAVGLRLLLARNLARPAIAVASVRRDTIYLMKGARIRRDGGLMWSYMPPPANPVYPASLGDYSNVNYAVLGLWSARDLNQEIREPIWRGLEKTWTQGQQKDGGWGYIPFQDITRRTPSEHRGPRGSMTAAGVASLYVILDECYAQRGEPGAYRDSAAYKSIQKGLKWLADHFDARTNPGRPHFASYYFYNCERVGAAAGVKYFGTHDWFREMAATILEAQKEDGSIPLGGDEGLGGVLVDTAFAVMFLAKGSAPILMNKLQHGGDWDNYPRDLATFTDWYAHASEAPANWQVVNLRGPAEDLTDSRILYIAGAEGLSFNEEERGKLRRFVELGGTLVFHPDSNAGAFRESVHKTLGAIWSDLELTPVNLAEHPLGTAYFPLKGPWRIEQLASPTRALAFVVDGTPAEAWQKRETRTREEAFEVGANLCYYATDLQHGQRPPSKLTFFAEPFRSAMPPTQRAVALARVRYGPVEHRWNPEPLAFEHFARRWAKEKQIACEIQVVPPGDLPACGARFAHLAGVDAVEFSKEETQAILTFLKGGGTLIVDQAGGPPPRGKEPFDAAIRRLLEAWFGAGSLQPLDRDDPLRSEVATLVYRNVEGQRRRRMPLELEHVVQNGRSSTTAATTSRAASWAPPIR